MIRMVVETVRRMIIATRITTTAPRAADMAVMNDVRIYNCAYVHHTCIGLIFLYMENSADAVITLITCTYMHLLLEQCIFNFQ